MGRRRKPGDILPAGVHAVRTRSATYYYYQPRRGTANPPPRIALGKTPHSPLFWAALAAARGSGGPSRVAGAAPGSWAALGLAWAASREWAALAFATRATYELRMRAIVKAWGNLPAAQTTQMGVVKLRDTLPGPAAANQLIAVIRAALKWGRAHGYRAEGLPDPCAGLEKLDLGEVEGAQPWPEWAYKAVLAEAPEALRRAAFLGRATGQRRSDLVRLGHTNRRADGLEFRIQKLGDKRHFMPLFADELTVIDGWAAPDIGPYIRHKGKPVSGKALAALLQRFCEGHTRLKAHPVHLHGLRALAVCDRRVDGLSHQEISGQLCMSVDMVFRYSKGIDTAELSRRANERRAAGRGRRATE
jgi:hypothetical protein